MFNAGAPGTGYSRGTVYIAGTDGSGSHALRGPHTTEVKWVVKVWWIYVVVVLLLVAGIYAFLQLVGFRTQMLTRRSTRTAEDMYENYADSPGKQKRYARRRGGEWRDEEPSRQNEEPGSQPVPPS